MEDHMLPPSPMPECPPAPPPAPPAPPPAPPAPFSVPPAPLLASPVPPPSPSLHSSSPQPLHYLPSVYPLYLQRNCIERTTPPLANLLQGVDIPGLVVDLDQNFSEVYLSIKIEQSDEQSGMTYNTSYKVPLSWKIIFNWAKKHADLDTYIRLFGTTRGYEGQMPTSMTYSSSIFPECNEIVEFVRSTLARCTWDFLLWEFTEDLYFAWHNRHHPGEVCMDRSEFHSSLFMLCRTNWTENRIGWMSVDSRSTTITPTVSMRKPEPLIRAYGLEKWMPLADGSCSDLAKQYDPRIHDNWLHYLTEVRCIDDGLCRLCKCDLSVLENLPFFIDAE